jgi:hypothetical protein
MGLVVYIWSNEVRIIEFYVFGCPHEGSRLLTLTWNHPLASNSTVSTRPRLSGVRAMQEWCAHDTYRSLARVIFLIYLYSLIAKAVTSFFKVNELYNYLCVWHACKYLSWLLLILLSLRQYLGLFWYLHEKGLNWGGDSIPTFLSMPPQFHVVVWSSPISLLEFVVHDESYQNSFEL